MLHRLTPRANENLIGIEARMQDLKSKLDIGSGGVRMIGIWGVGGGGKTTLASSVYSEISSKFEGCCHVENIRQKSMKNGLEILQEKILSCVLKQKEIEVNSVEEGRCLIHNRLRCKNVLLVLDDVDHLDHLQALAGSHNWFGEGSRIIITTRDVHLLNAQKVDVVHEIRLLNNDEAIELFYKHAPPNYKAIEDFKLLSKDVVSYAGGLPLALKVLGCFLCDKDINEWRSALARLKEIPEIDIVEKLKISYDGLKMVEKKLFLDIACFFRGQYNNEGIMAMLDACGFHPVIGIKVLVQKALITISPYGRFDMHDLVQEMAYYIVRGKHPKNPEKHSRVWKKEDVLKMCAMDATMELDMIEAIRFECNRYDPVELFPPLVANMKNLRWIDWRGDLASPFPTNFPPRELCCLKLDGISQKQLWQGYKNLPNLKILELCGLDKLIMTPDFDGLPSLERFKLTESSNLEEIHPSIGRLENLVFLSVENCDRLKMSPPITRVKKLETLTCSWCPKLFMFSDIHSGRELVSFKRKPLGLRFLHIGLKKLDLSYCNLRDEDIGCEIWDLSNLQRLNLRGNNLSRLDFSHLRIPRLKWLDISYCEGLVELSELPSSIAILIADHCSSLETIGDISKCKWIWKVLLRGENKLGSNGSEILLDSMLQGNAIENYFIHVTLEHHMISTWFMVRFFRTSIQTSIHLPDDWYNDFCGFLICVDTDMKYPIVNIIIKHDLNAQAGEQLINKALDNSIKSFTEDIETLLSIGYVSFSSLMHTTLSTTSYNAISFSIQNKYCNLLEARVVIELIPRKRKGDQLLKTKVTTDRSEFWDEDDDVRKTFRIQHDSSSSIKIVWHPYNWY
ncbi:unnamed protein product [Lactuca saligna]|uniref:ADP-ribosyl cyclase/cyclic ADP-ribose hydrolase n=1 Tax=Lactuca saligna TaxID=75948 RepID=A0AA35YAR6_LACSI|nr:unnamed protein product [Lactuca saligna]